MKILDTIWFSGSQGCMGIVLGVNEEGERKAYIGNATGSHEELDAQLIAQMGAPVMPKAADILFQHFNADKRPGEA